MKGMEMDARPVGNMFVGNLNLDYLGRRVRVTRWVGGEVAEGILEGLWQEESRSPQEYLLVIDGYDNRPRLFFTEDPVEVFEMVRPRDTRGN